MQYCEQQEKEQYESLLKNLSLLFDGLSGRRQHQSVFLHLLAVCVGNSTSAPLLRVG